MKMACDFSHCRPKQPEGPAAIIPCSGEEESEEFEFRCGPAGAEGEVAGLSPNGDKPVFSILQLRREA